MCVTAARRLLSGGLAQQRVTKTQTSYYLVVVLCACVAVVGPAYSQKHCARTTGRFKGVCIHPAKSCVRAYLFVTAPNATYR